MSFGNLIGPGYSGYAILNGIPIPMLPGNATENENAIKSAGSYGTDPAQSIGALAVRNRRSLQLSFNTFICPRTMPLVKDLVYGWRQLNLIDYVGEIPFTFIAGNQEGYEGTGYVDTLELTCDEGSLVGLTVSMTCYVWKEMQSFQPLPRLGRILEPFSDSYKPLPFWKTLPNFSGISSDAIPQSWNLSFNNNWSYQTFLGGYTSPPNPGLITAGDLDITFDITWVASRNSRPLDHGSLRLQLGVPPLDTIFIDRLIRDPQRQFTGTGMQNEAIKWDASYYVQGSIPRSN